MKKLYFILLLLSWCSAFSQPSTVGQLTTQINVIRNESQPGGNTRERIANMYQAVVNSTPNLLGSYANPSWIPSYDWTKITSTPTTLAGYGITNGQVLDADLTTIAGLAPASNDFLQYKSGNWANRTIAQVKSDLGVTSVLINGVTNTLIADTRFVTGSGNSVSIGSSSVTLQAATGSQIFLQYGGSAYPIAIGGSFITNGTLNFSLSGSTLLFLPTSGTLATTAQVATKQDLDSDLTSIAALNPSNDDFIQRKSGSWTNRTIAQVIADLGIPDFTDYLKSNTTNDFSGNTDFDGAGYNFNITNFNTLNIGAENIALTSASTNTFTASTANDFETTLNAFYDPAGFQPELRLFHGDGISNYISIQTPSLVSSWIFTLPNNDGNSGQAMITNGSGGASWANTVSSVTLTQPSAGLTISNSGVAITTTGTPTFALANDLAALEGLSSTGFSARTTTDSWAQRTMTGTTNVVDVTNGNGVSGNPTFTISSSYAGQASINSLGTSLTLGTGLTGVSRAITAAGSATDIDLLLIAKNQGTLQLSASGVIPFSINGTNAHVNIGQSALSTRMLDVYENFSSTNTVEYLQRLTRETNGTAANGIGVGIEYVVESAPSNDQIAALMEIVATDVSNASEDFDIVFKTMSNGNPASNAERLRISGDGVTVTYQTAVISLTGLTQINETTTSRTLTASDNQHLIYIKNSGSTSVVLPNGMPVGFVATFWMYESSGSMTLSATTTLRTPGGATQLLNDRETCMCWHEGSNIWNCKGDLH